MLFQETHTSLQTHDLVCETDPEPQYFMYLLHLAAPRGLNDLSSLTRD